MHILLQNVGKSNNILKKFSTNITKHLRSSSLPRNTLHKNGPIQKYNFSSITKTNPSIVPFLKLSTSAVHLRYDETYPDRNEDVHYESRDEDVYTDPKEVYSDRDYKKYLKPGSSEEVYFDTEETTEDIEEEKVYINDLENESPEIFQNTNADDLHKYAVESCNRIANRKRRIEKPFQGVNVDPNPIKTERPIETILKDTGITQEDFAPKSEIVKLKNTAYERPREVKMWNTTRDFPSFHEPPSIRAYPQEPMPSSKPPILPRSAQSPKERDID